nr:transposase [Rhizobium leguminosarum]
MPELGTLNRRQVASLAGVAPHPKDSGKASWHRSTTGGRRQIRPALFIAVSPPAVAIVRSPQPIRRCSRPQNQSASRSPPSCARSSPSQTPGSETPCSSKMN